MSLFFRKFSTSVEHFELKDRKLFVDYLLIGLFIIIQYVDIIIHPRYLMDVFDTAVADTITIFCTLFLVNFKNRSTL